MEVTYRANANILGHKAGQIYKNELTPQLEKLLLADKHLSLIDPPTLEPKRPEPPEVISPIEASKENETKKKSGRKPVENTDKDDDDNGRAEEREEGI